MHRARGEAWTCVAIDTTCQGAFAKTTFRRNDYYCGKHKHNGVKFETGVVHRGPLQGLIVWLRGPFPAAFNDYMIAKESGGILSQLAENEKVTADKAYSADSKTITPVYLRPAKWSKRRLEAAKKHNQFISSLHVIVENRNESYSRFGVCERTFRHSNYDEVGPNLELLGRYWEIVTFLINRNTLDSAGQTTAWCVPTRPLRTSGWPNMAEGVSQEQDDAFGPTGPRRGGRRPQRQPLTTFSPQRQPLATLSRTRDRFAPLGALP